MKRFAIAPEKIIKAINGFSNLEASEQDAVARSLLPKQTSTMKEMFLPHKLLREPFPSAEKKTVNMVNLLKNYLKSINNEEVANGRLVNDLLGAMMRNSCTFDVFYFGFSKYLNEIDDGQVNELLSHELFLFERLEKDLFNMAYHCTERELAASIGYFMDILGWDTREESKDLESISLYSIKKNILHICKENILNSVFFPPFMLYEMGLREKNLYKREKYFDYCLNMLNRPHNHVGSLLVKINNSHSKKIKTSIYLEWIHNFYTNNDSEQLYTYLKSLKESFSDLSKIKVADLSFNLSCEDYTDLIQKIQQSMSYFGLKKTDDFHVVEVEKILNNFLILSNYYFLLEFIIDQCAMFQKFRIALDTEAIDVKELMSGSAHKYRDDAFQLLTKMNEIFQEGAISFDDMNKKIYEIKAMIVPLKQQINASLDIIKEPYYAAIKQYILSLIPEEFSKNFMDETHGKDNNISFLFNSCRHISKLIKKHENILSFNAGVLTLNIYNMGIQLDDITNIVNEIYRVKKRIQDQKLIIQAPQPIYKQVSKLSLQAIQSRSEIDTAKSSETDDTFSLTNIKNERVPQQTVRNEKRQRYKQKATPKTTTETKDKSNQDKLMAKAIKFLEPKHKEESGGLVEAQNYTLGFIQNSTMKKAIIVAVNKKLVDQNRVNISNKSQAKINRIVQDICFVSKFGQDGIKRYNHIYRLKIRYADNKSYRADPSEIKSDDELMVVKYDKVIDKVKMKRRK